MKKSPDRGNLNDKNIQETQSKKEVSSQYIKNKIIRVLMVIISIIIVYVAFSIFFPERYITGLNMSSLYAKEMISIFPAVLLIMGLADVWIPSSLIKKYLGKEAKIKGKILAVGLGTLPTGPMYIALPLAGELIRKKASISNVIVFLGVWASLKIPQIGIEIKFLGLKFATLRFIFTLTSIFIIGFIIEKVIESEAI